MSSSRLGAEGVTIGYGGEPVVRDLTLDLPDGLVTTVVGPNGCGKSTLLRTLARLLKPAGGTVRLDGEPIDAVSTREVSRRLALLRPLHLLCGVLRLGGAALEALKLAA